MYSTVVLILAMVTCLTVNSCTISTSSMPSTTSTHIFEMPISMVSTLTVLLLLHWPKALMMLAPFLLNSGLAWLGCKQADQEKDG